MQLFIASFLSFIFSVVSPQAPMVSPTGDAVFADTIALIPVSTEQVLLLAQDTLLTTTQLDHTSEWKKQTTVNALHGADTFAPLHTTVAFQGQQYMIVTTDTDGDPLSFDPAESFIFRFSEDDPLNPTVVTSLVGDAQENQYTALVATENNLYATTATGEIYSSKNGEQWSAVETSGLPQKSYIADAAATDTTLYILIENTMYKSTDGRTWTALEGPYTTHDYVRFIDASHDTLFVTTQQNEENQMLLMYYDDRFTTLVENTPRIDAVVPTDHGLYIATSEDAEFGGKMMIQKKASETASFTTVHEGVGTVEGSASLGKEQLFVVRDKDGQRHIVHTE